MDDVRIAYDRSELSGIKRAFKAMDAEALDQAKQASAEIAEMLKEKIIRKAQTRQIAGASARRIAEGARVAKSRSIPSTPLITSSVTLDAFLSRAGRINGRGARLPV